MHIAQYREDVSRFEAERYVIDDNIRNLFLRINFIFVVFLWSDGATQEI